MLKAKPNYANIGKVFPSSGDFGWLKLEPTVVLLSEGGDVDVTYEYWRSDWNECLYERVKIAESSSFQSKAEASGIRFASRDSVKVASSWMIAHYAETFKNLAEPKEKPKTNVLREAGQSIIISSPDKTPTQPKNRQLNSP